MKYILLISLLLLSSILYSQNEPCDCSNPPIDRFGASTAVYNFNGKSYQWFVENKTNEGLCIPHTFYKETWPKMRNSMIQAIKNDETFKKIKSGYETEYGEPFNLIENFKKHSSGGFGGFSLRADVQVNLNIDITNFVSSFKTCTEVENKKQNIDQNQSNSNSSSSNNSNSNSSSNSNSDNTYENKMNKVQTKIDRIEANSKALEEQLISNFNTIQQNMAKERDFQNKVNSLTFIQATDANSIISEARRKSKELDIVFNQKSTDAYNEINKIGTDLAGSAENNEQLILSGGLTIGMHILSQNSIKKAREEAKRQLDVQKENELQKIADKIINKYSPIKKTSYERIPFTVLKEEEQYFNEQYHFSKCMCDNARKIITNDFECDKITLKYQIQKEAYSAEEYYNAFKRKSNSEKKRIQEKAEYFLDLAITHKNSKAVWLIDKANYGDYNTYQKLIFANKALAIDAENLIIQEAYSKFKKKYQTLSKQASLHSKIMTNNNFDWDKHSGLFVVKIEDTYFMCQENGVVISPEIKMFLLSEFNNDVSIFIKEPPSNNNNNYFGLIDKSGNVITKEKYNYIEQFSDDLALAKNESGYQYINNKGENVFNKIYNGAFSFKDGVARVSNSNDNDKSVNNSISASIQSSSQFYFINTKGERILTNDFDIIGDFSEGLALARNNKRELVFLNTDGQVEFEVDHKLKVMNVRELSNFKNGFSLLRKSTSQFYYLDKKGNIVIKTSYFNPQPFNENRALVSNFKDGKLTFSFIDTKGKLICDFEYDGASNFSEGRAAVSKDGKWGFIDLNGKLIIPLNYDSLGVFKNGIAGIVENGKFYKIDLNGKIIE